jgi:sugar lactone lactonase YvrE
MFFPSNYLRLSAMTQLLNADLPLSRLGEGAFWSKKNSTLYWVDIPDKVVHAYNLSNDLFLSWRLSKEVSFAIPQQDGHLLVGLSDGIYRYDPETGDEAQISLLDIPKSHRLNDGKLDPAGRLWVGTINTDDEPSENAALYLLRNSLFEKVEGVYLNANGKAWNPNGSIMYHADTSRGAIWRYNYDLPSGMLSNKMVFVSPGDWSPDGLCMDLEGNLLVAVFGGARVERYSPRGERLSDIKVLVPKRASISLRRLVFTKVA